MKKGYTLVEIIVVIAIIAITATLLIPQVSGYIQTSKKTVALDNCQSLSRSSLEYLAQNIDKNNEEVKTYLNNKILEGEVTSLTINKPIIEFSFTYQGFKTVYKDGKCSLE